MSIYRELSHDRVVSRVRGIQFCVLSGAEIRRRSVLEVTENQTYAGNEPVANGLFDTRMGVVDANRVCATCQQRNTFCPGHFGHVTLARPVFHIQFFDVVRKLMKCVCFRCSRILVDLESPEARAILSRKMSRQRRWDAMSKLCFKVRRCGQDTLEGCGARVPDKVVKVDSMTMNLKLVWREGEAGGGSGAGQLEVVFTADDVLRVLRRVSDLDAEALGFSSEFARPDWLICTVLPVPPPAVRPSVRQDSGQRQEDDLTHKLADIVKVNRDLARAIERGTVPAETIDTVHVPLLQYHVATLIDNSLPSLNPSKDRAGRMLRSLTERLCHKEGRIRGNLMGKRVDFSARTVITPDPNLSIDELGVPMRIAMNLTFPDVVCDANAAEMRALVRAGPDTYPGAKQVRKAAEGNRTIRLRGHPDRAGVAEALQPGDVVDRHLRNGDYVLFNRQPSLHKMSMMGHRVRVMPYNTFRLNVCVCASYNADFDGDEMNMHVPQSLQTHYEVKELAAVPLHVLSPRYSKPIITIVQDVALGVFRITQPDVSVSRRQFFNLLGGCAPQSALWALHASAAAAAGGASALSGRDVLSTVLPPTAAFRKPGEADAEPIVIEGGRILSGVLSRGTFSRASSGLVHQTYNTLGPAAVTAMLNSTQKLICDWLVMSGFSVGVSDLVVPADKAAQVRDAMARAKRGVQDLLVGVHAGTFENNSTKSDADFLEDSVRELLARGDEEANGVVRGAAGIANNRMLNMIVAGSKGSGVNFRQMTACLGQQDLEGRRVPDGFDHRTLPHFTKYDDGPEARGFVQRSFIDGLAPHEFFFHAMAGRIGLIDTAVRTSETGYLQRRLVKAMEDCKVHHDLTVRNANGHVVQFLYGEDGMDAIKMEFQELPYMASEPADMREAYLIADVDAELGAFMRPAALRAVDGAALRPRIEAHFAQLLDDRRGVISGLLGGLRTDQPIVYPVNLLRIVEQAAVLDRQASGGGGDPRSDLDPAHVLDQIEALERELVIGGEPRRDGEVHWMPILLRCFLSPKPLIAKHRLSRRAFDQVVQQARADFAAARASPGDMVGILAATSLGEPCTQLSTISECRVQVCAGGGTMYDGAIGPYIDGLLAQRAAEVVDLGGDSVVLDLPPGEALIVGVSDDEKTSWRSISQVSRHPANGGMVRIHTRSGKTTCATLSHSFLTRAERGVVPIKGSDLRVGMRVPVARRIPPVSSPVRSMAIGGRDHVLTRDLGWLCGAYLADGSVTGKTTISISKVIPAYQEQLRRVYAETFNLQMWQSCKQPRHHQSGCALNGWDMGRYAGTENVVSSKPLAEFLSTNFNVGSHNKRIPAWVYSACPDFQRGLLCGYFDGDGNVNAIPGKQMIRSASVSEKLTEDVVLLLARFGIFASKCRERGSTHPPKGARADAATSDPQAPEPQPQAGGQPEAEAEPRRQTRGRACWLHTAQVSRKHARRFRDEVGPLVVPEKDAALREIIAYVERDDKHSSQEVIDKIPCLGGLLEQVGRALRMEGQSRLYGRFAKKESIGRETLREYVARFEQALVDCAAQDEADLRQRLGVASGWAAAAAAAASPVSKLAVGDELGAELALMATVTGNTCMRAYGAGGRLAGIQAATLAKYAAQVGAAAEKQHARSAAALADVRDDKLPALRQALHADVVWDEIVELEHLPDPQQHVYDFTVPGNDSFMVDCGVLVHNTLNSVVHGTELMLRGGGAPPGPPAGSPRREQHPRALEVPPDSPQVVASGVGGPDVTSEIAPKVPESAPRGGPRGLRPLRVTIGELVDARMAEAEADGAPEHLRRRLERHPNDTTLLWLKDGGDEGPGHSGLETLSVDEDGRVSWREVTAVTRHPVVNRDGSDTLIEVTTESGRSVVATRGKSFLTRRGNKVVATDGEELRVGDHLPVTRLLPVAPEDELQFLELDRWLPRTEYLYESELAKALALRASMGERSRWFSDPVAGNGHGFVVPHSRSDSLLECKRSNDALEPERRFRTGCVYPKKLGPCSRGHVPERLPLDALTGFFMGAYLAEGSEGNSQVHISNVDPDYQARVQDFAERMDVGWHLADNSNKRGRSEDVCVHSKASCCGGDAGAGSGGEAGGADVVVPLMLRSQVLSDLVIKMCGRGAANKRLPAELLAANRDFLRGLVDGYFSGDGDCPGTTYVVNASSVSRGLLEDMAAVLVRFNIGCSITTRLDKCGVTEKGTPILPIHKLRMRNGDAQRFAETFVLTKKQKQEALRSMLEVQMVNPCKHTPEDVVPQLLFPSIGTTVPEVHRDKLPAMLRHTVAELDRAAIEAAMREEVAWDKVVSIVDVPNPSKYVYDLTVSGTRTFVLANGTCVQDTFHLAGSATGAKVTRGVPRMKELMSVSKNIKTPSMHVRLRREWAARQDAAQEALSSIETTHFRDVVSRSAVYYDPGDAAPPQDAELLRFRRAFDAAVASGAGSAAGCGGDASASPWLLRFEFDHMKMLDMRVTMLDLEAALLDFYDDAVGCVLSDDSAETLVCRLRLPASAADSADLLTEVKALEQAIMDSVVIKGVPRINKAMLQKPNTLQRYDAASDAFVADDEWTIETTGSNLMDVLAHPCVDPTRTFTNDVYETYLVLGIEAARQVLINEMNVVLTMDPGIDHRHISLLADTMTNRGFFMSIDRHGINNRGELGPLAKCSFEQTTDMLIKAGMFAERDRINGVSANIMLGQVAPCGTGDCTILLDTECIELAGRPVGAEPPPPAAGAQGQGQGQGPPAPAAAANVPEAAVFLPAFGDDILTAQPPQPPGDAQEHAGGSGAGMLLADAQLVQLV